MKFAYLIMAHDNTNQLITLLKLLDDAENDIYLHIDKKSKVLNENQIRYAVVKANLFVYSVFNVKWAGLSQTKCQSFLLEEAIKTEHDYYHFLSGHDLPLKTNKEINAFFQKNAGKEFIHFESDDFCLKDVCRYYHFENSVLERFFINLQKKIDIRRKLYCGANWYSITHNLATEFIKNKKKMFRIVNRTISSDEYILQTFYRRFAKGDYQLYKTTKNPYDYESVARLIDWRRGSPYVWRKEDFNELINSGRMFARKFDEKIDNEIIQMIVGYINGICAEK